MVYQAILQVIALVCEYYPRLRLGQYLTHSCDNLPYCPIFLAIRYIYIKLDSVEAVIGLEKTYYPVSERSIGEVEICVTVYRPSVECPIQFPFTLILKAIDGTAGMCRGTTCMYINETMYDLFSVAAMDYIQNAPVTLQFEKCNRSQCHCIPITNDDILEGNEAFYVSLEGPANLDKDKIILDQVVATVNVNDD